jgi:hypothetical protein
MRLWLIIMFGKPGKRPCICWTFWRRQAVDILKSVPPGVAYKYNVKALKDRFRDHQPMVAHWSQLKAWVTRGICSGHWAVGLLRPSWVAQQFRPEGGSLCAH